MFSTLIVRVQTHGYHEAAPWRTAAWLRNT